MKLLASTGLTVDRPGAPILRFPDQAIEPGGRVLLLGPSGCGKTTLLSILAGLLPPTEGTMRFRGDDLYALRQGRRDGIRGKHYGFVFQSLHLLPSLTLRQNVALAGDLTGRADHGRIDRVLDRLGLTAKAHRRPTALSQGEQQRAAIARAVINRPAVIVADEPTSALDDANAMTVMDLLDDQAAETGAALVIATHDQRIKDRFERIVNLGNTAGAA